MRALAVAMLLAIATPSAAEPTDWVTRPLVLAQGELDARLVTEINLAPGRFASPLSLSPDIWLGVAPKWTVGLIHSNSSVDRIAADATLCIRQRDAICERLYRGGGIDVRYSALAGDFAVAPRVRVLLRDVDPAKPAITVGALIRWTHSRFLIASDPYVRVGLANTNRGNRGYLMLPFWFGVQPTCRWLIALRTGWDSELDVARDGWHGQLALSVRAAATDHIDVAVEAGFASLYGPQNNIKTRAAFITVGWRGKVF
ncbi:MAG: hypothetical protein SFX73_09095 [Kofleriaceae bacterium]|nr:hypothetical protein [Kofleriaceae bacterium]